MHRSFRDLASHGNSAVYPNIQLNPHTLGTSYKTFSIYLKPQFVNIYRVDCTIANCFVCENSTDVSYFSPLFGNHKCMHFKLANWYFLFVFSLIFVLILFHMLISYTV